MFSIRHSVLEWRQTQSTDKVTWNNCSGARDMSVNFSNSSREFSVKFGIFSKLCREVTHFPPWIRLVPNNHYNGVGLNELHGSHPSLSTPTVDAWEWGFRPRLCVCVCLSVCFSTWYNKNWCNQTWHKNILPWVPETHLFWGRKVKDQSHEAPKKQCRRGYLHSYECWLFLVVYCILVCRNCSTGLLYESMKNVGSSFILTQMHESLTVLYLIPCIMGNIGATWTLNEHFTVGKYQ